MSPVPANLLAYRRAGFEKECAQELVALAQESAVQGFVKARPESAFAVFHPHDGGPAAAFARRVDATALVFPRQVVRCGALLADMPVGDRVTPIVAEAQALKDVARRVPLERMLVQTDSPYLAPVPHRGRTNEPAYVRHVAEEVPRLKEVPLEAVAEATTRNFFSLLAFNWRGSMMANAGRDPIFWATLAIAEQDFDGAGDLCIRCHSAGGWYAGRSTPTDGSALMAGDADGVDCDTCHKMTNPSQTELPGVMNPPFLANNGAGLGYYGSGMLSLSGNSAKLGPYSDAVARHQFTQSKFHRDVSFCGSCHDVSNPAVGDLAHNNGTQFTADAVIASGVPGSPVDGKAAFNNFP